MEAKFKAALARDPWDRALRLVYADWLEEQRRPEAAEKQRRLALKKQQRPAGGRPPGARDTCATTGCSAVYRKLQKQRAEEAGDIHCGRCPWHGGENAGRRPRHTSWKKVRKTRWRAR